MENKNNILFPLLKLIAPHRLLWASFLIWLFSIVSIPTTYLNMEPMFWPVVLLSLNVLAFYLGMKIINFKVVEQPAVYKDKDRFIFFSAFIVGFFGTLLRAYQILIQQGYLYAAGDTWKRMEMASGELNSGVLGLMTALTQPFGFLAFLLLLYHWRKYAWYWVLLALPLGVYPIMEAYFTQGRLQVVKIFLMIVVVFFFYLGHHRKWSITLLNIKFYKYPLLRIPKKIVSAKILVTGFILSTVFYVFFVFVIESRLDAFGYSNVIEVWEGYQEMRVDDDFKERVMHGNNQNLDMAKYSLLHYFAHGPVEFVRRVNHIQRPYGTYYGMYTFHPYVKFFKLIGFNPPSQAELSEIIKRKAVYTTFWGDMYLDFGWFSILLTFFLGAIIKQIYLKALKGELINILFYAYFSFVVFGSMFLNLLSGSSLYILNALFVLWVLYKYTSDELVFKI